MWFSDSIVRMAVPVALAFGLVGTGVCAESLDAQTVRRSFTSDLYGMLIMQDLKLSYNKVGACLKTMLWISTLVWIISLSLLIFLSSTDVSESIAADDVLSAKPSIIEIGDVACGNSIQKILSIYNSGVRPLAIKRIDTTCGCTRLSPVPDSIPANSSVKIKVAIENDTVDRVQKFLQSLFVVCEDLQSRKAYSLTILISGRYVPSTLPSK